MTAVTALGADVSAQQQRLAELRRALHQEIASAVSPAVKQTLSQADAALFLALTYLGHTETLFPGQA